MYATRSGPGTITRAGLFAVWLCFVLRGCFYSASLPLWEGVDEYSHFAYLQSLYARRTLPVRADGISRELEQSMALAPAPWGFRHNLPPQLPHDLWWRLPEQERRAREARIHAIPPAWAVQRSSRFLPLYEAQQPPLAYVALAPAYAALARAPLLARVWVLRFLCVLVASLSIPLVWRVAYEVLGDHRPALGAAALLAVLPQFTMGAARISNEGFATVAGALLLLAAVRLVHTGPWLRQSLVLGGAAAVALLTKAYFLAALPAVAALFLGLAVSRKYPLRVVCASAATVAGVLVLVAGWCYYRNLTVFGTISGEQTEAAADSGSSVAGVVDAARRVPWSKAATSAFHSHVWIGNWSFLSVRTWMYTVLAVGVLAAIAGLVLRMVRPRRSSPESRPGLAVLAVFLAFLVGALAWHALTIFRVVGVASTPGWYLYGFAAAEVVLLVAGLTALVPDRYATGVVAAAITCCAALDLFGMHVYLLPYYTGLIAHQTGGGLPGYHWFPWSTAALGRITSRLAVNKPAWLGAHVMGGLWLGYVAGTLALIAESLRGRTSEETRIW